MDTNKYLITVDDIKVFRPLAELDAERINPYILEAQRHDLRPVLSDALYFDFMKYFDNTDPSYDKYRDLLKGKEYTYGGTPTQYEGLIEMLAFFTLARFFPNNNQHMARYGNVRKKTEFSEPLDPKEIAATVAELKSNAVFFIPKVRQFITQNAATYPLYPRNPVENLNRGGVKFFDI